MQDKFEKYNKKRNTTVISLLGGLKKIIYIQKLEVEYMFIILVI